MKHLLLTTLVIISGVVIPEIEAGYKVICYYGSWGMSPDKIDPSLCTHIIFAFAGITDSNNLQVDSWNSDILRSFVQLKQRNPAIKTMVAVGGWNEGSARFSKIASSDANRRLFARNAAAFLKSYRLDGLDIDWEYPNQREGSTSADKDNFVLLLKVLNDELKNKNLLLSAAVGATMYAISQSYNVRAITQYLDFINLMTYDLHGGWETKTGQRAPLYDTKSNANVKSCVEAWLNAGADPKKLILGMPFYGVQFILSELRCNRANCPAKGTDLSPTYVEVLAKQKTMGWTRKWDSEQKVPYMYSKNKEWIGYDDPKSLELKVNFAKQKGLGGGMIWSINQDDVDGTFGKKYPLLKAINNAFNNRGSGSLRATFGAPPPPPMEPPSK